MAPLSTWLILLGGCAIDRAAIRSDDQEHGYLQDSAAEYWRFIRWGAPERAAIFIESPDDRPRFLVQMNERMETQRLTDAAVLEVRVEHALGDGTQPDAAGHWRLGEVVVRTEGYTLPAQILRTEEQTQRWYRTPDGWWLDWTADAAE